MKWEHDESLKNSSSDWEKRYNKAVESHSKELDSIWKKHEEDLGKWASDFEAERKKLLEQMEWDKTQIRKELEDAKLIEIQKMTQQSENMLKALRES